MAHEKRWDEQFLRQIGLGDLPDERCGQSSDILPIGALAGLLTAVAAPEMGLHPGTAVAVGAIDAHAGGIGLLGASFDGDGDQRRLSSSLALIGGTSSCHMAVSTDPQFIPGVWGPYYGAMVPGMWLTEGGQSAAGALIDFVIDSHPAAAALADRAKADGVSRYDILDRMIDEIATQIGLDFPALVTRDLHILDYHLGNRSPFADPRAKGVADGLDFDVSLQALAVTYAATVQAVAYGTRRIIDALGGGYAMQRILVTGGGTKSPVWLREHADATGLELRMGEEPESVVLGAAIIGSVAAGVHPDIPTAMLAMSRPGAVVSPNPRAKAYHDAKYDCYKRLYQCHIDNRQRMSAH